MQRRLTNSEGAPRRSTGGLARPGLDAAKLVGIVCACYIAAFALLLQAHGPVIDILASKPSRAMPLLCGTGAIVVSLLLSQRMASLLSWSFVTMIVSSFLEVPTLDLAESGQVSLTIFGLGLPFLILLEVILTMEGATAKARVVFRLRPLLKVLAISAAVLLSLLAAFSYIPVLRQYSASPEAATFQTAVIAGVATIVLASILLARPRSWPDRS